MSNRLRLTGILTPPADDTWKAGTGYVRFEPANTDAANWSVPGYKPAWPVIGVPNATGTGLQEANGGDLYVPGDEPGDSYAGPWMLVSYELQTTGGNWHRGKYLWRAVSTGGGAIDLRTPAPELEPPTVQRPGVPADALTTADIGNTVAAQSHTHTAAQITDLGSYREQTVSVAPNSQVPLDLQTSALYAITPYNNSGVLLLMVNNSIMRVFANLSMTFSSIAVSTGAGASETQKEPATGQLKFFFDANGVFVCKNTLNETVVLQVKRLSSGR